MGPDRRGRAVAVPAPVGRRSRDRRAAPPDLGRLPRVERALVARFENASTPAWNATSDTLYFHADVGVSTLLAAVPASGGAVRLVADRRGDAGQLAISRTGRAAWIESHPRSPDEIVVADHPQLEGVP